MWFLLFLWWTISREILGINLDKLHGGLPAKAVWNRHRWLLGWLGKGLRLHRIWRALHLHGLLLQSHVWFMPTISSYEQSFPVEPHRNRSITVLRQYRRTRPLWECCRIHSWGNLTCWSAWGPAGILGFNDYVSLALGLSAGDSASLRGLIEMQELTGLSDGRRGPWPWVCSCLFIFVYHMLDMLGGDDPTIDNEFVTFSYYPRVWLWNVGRQNHKPEVVQGNCLNKLDEDHTMPHHWRVLCSSSISFRSFRFVASPHKEGMK